MILKTKVPVTFNKPMSGTETAVLIGDVRDQLRQGVDYYGANYSYILEDGTVIMQNSFNLKSEAEIIALNDMIKADLPVYEDTIEPVFEQLKVYLAFRLEMFKLLTVMNPELTLEDIEISDDVITYQ